jgi:lipopolysaccharide transport system ATP-binding protein
MTSFVLSARDVGKFFRRYPSRWLQLWELVTGRQTHHAHWVFRNLSFNVSAGEAVGVVGRNGAGKSTLLKLLTGLQQPSAGTIERRGKIAAILELGVGFHPEFTGRENARQMALVQGLTEEEVEESMPSIEAFAEIGTYFDEPVHTYSSGMQMRLAFSVATAVQPDLLIVDEALAVGDAYFQHKCYQRIRTMRDGGAAVLMVSHDPASVRSLCSRAILIHEGKLFEDGTPSDVLETYNMLLAPDLSRQHELLADAGTGCRAGTGEVQILSVEFRQEGQARRALVSEMPAQLGLQLEIRQPVGDLTVGILIRDRLGNDVFGTNTHHHGMDLPAQEEGIVDVTWDIAGFHLGPGHYSLTVAAHAGVAHPAGNYDWWDRCLTFQVLPQAGPLSIGPSSMELTVAFERARGGH